MTQREIFDRVSIKVSKLTTHAYSTSFSIGIRCLHPELRNPIYAIYGFVRFADEIVDTLHEFDKQSLFEKFRDDTHLALRQRVSLNPILHSFQSAVHEFAIDPHLVDQFLASMETDLNVRKHDAPSFEQYILGSAESVGLMCLHVFCKKDKTRYEQLKPFAMKLGAAFQKINFVRDLNADFNHLGRSYFPGIDVEKFDETSKRKIELNIRQDFEAARAGIRLLPRSSRWGVYVSYLYYQALFRKIMNTPSQYVLKERIRIRNRHKISILCYSFVKHQLNLI